MFSKAAGLPEQRERMKVLYPDGGDVGKTSKPLAKRTESGILNDKGYKGIPITEEAIRRVPQVRPDGWSQEQAERLQTAHRELLRAVMDKSVGTEAGAVYTPDMRLIERKIGENAGHQIVMPRYQMPHIFIHNHPSGLTFSMADIENFGTRFNLETMTAIGPRLIRKRAKNLQGHVDFRAVFRAAAFQGITQRSISGPNDGSMDLMPIDDLPLQMGVMPSGPLCWTFRL